MITPLKQLDLVIPLTEIEESIEEIMHRCEHPEDVEAIRADLAQLLDHMAAHRLETMDRDRA